MPKFSTVLIGEETLLIGCADQLLDAGHEIAAVVSHAPQIRSWATAKGLTLLGTPADLQERFTPGAFDWLLSIANLAMLPESVLALPARGAINFHDGPLPDYAGLNTPAWALLNGRDSHGVSWHLMQARADTGDLLVTREVPIGPEETAHSLNSKCYAAGLESFADLLAQLEAGALERHPQELTGRSYFGGAKRPHAAGYIDLSRPAAELAATARALDFGGYWQPLGLPKLFTGTATLLPKSVSVSAVVPTPEAAPGTVLESKDGTLVLATGDGALHLADLTDTAGKPLPARALPKAGEALPVLSGVAADALRNSAETLAQHEGAWRKRLARLEPLPVPLAEPAAGQPDWQDHALDLPAGLDRAARLAALALWAVQGAHRTEGDIAFTPAALGTSHSQAPAIAAPWVPLHVAAQPDATLTDTVAGVAEALGFIDKHQGFAADLPLRDPALAGVEAPAVLVSEGPVEPVPGTCLHLVLDEAGTCTLRVDRARLDQPACELLIARLRQILRRMAEDGSARLAEVIALPDAERALMLQTWNDTAADYDPNLTIHRAFEAQAARTPDATALVFEAQELSYAELDARANAVADALVAEGVAPGEPVGLCIRRSPELVIGALGILKAGGAYVPLDPDFPADRIGHIVEDSAARVVLAHRPTEAILPETGARRVLIEEMGQSAAAPAQGDVSGESLAYLTYTSGSTGKPKGVMVEHRNVANFFRGMDDCVDREAGAVWVAVTSISFDISVLELFYTLARGFKVVVSSGETRAAVAESAIAVSSEPIEFSLYYWGNDDGPGPQKYQLLLDGARFADENGFCAVWTPERHFHAFGGPYPNPSVTGAAVAAVTRNIAVRAGSCVAPLHHPARIAEDWAVIDNLTAGRAGLAFASGWHPDDFVLRPENAPPHNKTALFDSLRKVRALWRGEAVEFETQGGQMLPVKTLPRPVSPELETWVTTAGNPDTWREAGENGAHILTHLLGQTIEEVADKIRLYHNALREAGHDPAQFKVTVMLHSYIAETREAAREVAREPMKSYLRSAAGLIKQYAWAFPAFKKPEGVTNPFQIDLGALEDSEMEAILDFAFERYFEDAGLFGTVADGVARAEQLKRIGVTEIACLIDYGIAPATVLEGLTPLAEVLKAANTPTGPAEDDFSLAAQIVRHRATHLQCTPSMARLLTMNDEARHALRGLRQMLVGGEALPGDLVAELQAATRARITNMYGPTETTVWSTSHALTGAQAGHTAEIGRPIANTSVYVLDEAGQPVPTGATGELCIGGHGVTRGYWRREELTAEKFVPDPFGHGRLYRTGDVARWTSRGTLAFLGRADHQVKIRGQRIQLGEIEACLAQFPGVTAAVVAPREAPTGDARLVGYFTSGAAIESDRLRTHLKAFLPEAMVPAEFMRLDAIPLTANKKVDRKALPEPTRAEPSRASAAPLPEGSEVSRVIASVWSQVLGVSQIGPDDNFFDLGGHSLLAVQAHRDIRKAISGQTISITDIFRFPVLKDLARHIEKASGGSSAAAPAPEQASEARSATMSKRRAMRAERERQAS
ncbi:MAG: LLM class flavin-dependent oxidoreductase [Roseovarius sp.]